MSLEYKQIIQNGYKVWAYVSTDYYSSDNPSGFVTSATVSGITGIFVDRLTTQIISGNKSFVNRVAIGTAGAPSFQLDVNGTGNFNSGLFVSGNPVVTGGPYALVSQLVGSIQNAVTGFGTVSYVPVFTANNSGLMNSIVYQSGYINGYTGVIVTGFLGISGLATGTFFNNHKLQVFGAGAVVSDVVRGLNGAAQTETLLIFGSMANANNNLAHFDNNQANSRATFTISNSATAWNNNFVQVMVHGTTYSTANYLSLPNSGLALILGQGAEISRFSIGMFNNTPVSFFNNNIERLIIDTAGNINTKTNMQVTGHLLVSGRQYNALRARTITSNYTASPLDDIILTSGTGANVFVTLPVANLASGRLIRIKKIDSGNFSAIISGNNIDSETGILLVARNQSISVVSDGSTYFTF